jgi:adenylate kinase family enzyme
VIVEFIGLPGSGKSTLMRQLFSDPPPAQEVRYLPEEAALLQVARRKIDRIFRTPLKLLPHGLAVRVCPRLWWRSRQRSECLVRFLARHGAALGAFTSSAIHEAMSTVDRFRVIESFLETGAVREFLDDTQMADRIVLFGEGLVQKSFMFVDHSEVVVEPADVVCYLEKIPLPDLVIHLRVSTSVSFERMTGRASGPTQRLKATDAATTRRFLDTAAHLFDLLSGCFAQNHPDRMLTIDNHESAVSAAAAIRERLAEL